MAVNVWKKVKLTDEIWKICLLAVVALIENAT